MKVYDLPKEDPNLTDIPAKAGEVNQQGSDKDRSNKQTEEEKSQPEQTNLGRSGEKDGNTGSATNDTIGIP